MSVEKYWNCTSKWELNKDDTFCHLKRTMHQSVLIRIMSVMFSIGTDTGGGGGGACAVSKGSVFLCMAYNRLNITTG